MKPDTVLDAAALLQRKGAFETAIYRLQRSPDPHVRLVQGSDLPILQLETPVMVVLLDGLLKETIRELEQLGVEI